MSYQEITRKQKDRASVKENIPTKDPIIVRGRWMMMHIHTQMRWGCIAILSLDVDEEEAALTKIAGTLDGEVKTRTRFHREHLLEILIDHQSLELLIGWMKASGDTKQWTREHHPKIELWLPTDQTPTTPTWLQLVTISLPEEVDLFRWWTFPMRMLHEDTLESRKTTISTLDEVEGDSRTSRFNLAGLVSGAPVLDQIHLPKAKLRWR